MMTAQSKNGNETWPVPNPRVAGVREHYERVKFFAALADKCSDPDGRFRLLLAGVYFARGVVELMFEAADKGELKRTRNDLKKHLGAHILWYDLIEKVRIHDFHRFGLLPSNSQVRIMMQGGPIKLKAQTGVAVCSLTASGPEMVATGNSQIKEERPLLSDDGKFFDDTTHQYVSLELILRDFISSSVKCIREFEDNLKPIE
jgi:hypothetical protein